MDRSALAEEVRYSISSVADCPATRWESTEPYDCPLTALLDTVLKTKLRLM